MNNRKYPYIYFIDSLIILLNISNSYSIVPYLVFFQYHRAINTGIIIILNTIYLMTRFKGCVHLKYPLIISLYILICTVNVVAALVSNTFNHHTWLYLLSNFTFFILLYNFYLDYKKNFTCKVSLWLIIRGYLWLSIYCVMASVLLFVLMKVGLNTHQHEITSQMDLFAANSEQFNTNHYFPYNLSMVIDGNFEIVKMPFFNEKGIICGLYHEPHILTFMVFPALFLLFAYIKSWSKKLLLSLLWILILLMTTSTTNIIAFLVCVILLMSYYRLGKIALVPLLYFVVLLIAVVGLENTELFFIADKLEGGSMNYSMGTIEFAFSPHTFLGSNFLDNSYLRDSETGRRDVGYINFVLNIIFVAVFIWNIVNTLRSKEKEKRIIGLAGLYFFLHSMKVAMVSYSLSMLIFLVFIIYVINSKKLYTGQ